MKQIKLLRKVYYILAIEFGLNFTKYYSFLSFYFKDLLNRIAVYVKVNACGDVVAIAVVQRYQNQKNRLHIAYIFTNEKYRRLGIATELITYIENYYSSIGIEVVSCYVFSYPITVLLQKLKYEVYPEETAKFAYWDNLNKPSVDDEEAQEKEDAGNSVTVLFKHL
jgi:GNAT superfamily N-acetyltransferase